MSHDPAEASDITALQRDYYAQTAAHYDQWHLDADEEHNVAVYFLLGMIERFGFQSILDVGAGTGRTLDIIKARRPGVMRRGVEPVAAMRAAAYEKGISETELTDGDACCLPFADGEFDVVCAFGVLHHIRHPELAIREMLRVARRGVFISDMNCYGFGHWPQRLLKRTLRSLGLWKPADWLLTRGKGYRWDEGDGVWYSYSLFDSLPLIREQCPSYYLLKTKGEGADLYRSCSHVAVLALKDEAGRRA